MNKALIDKLVEEAAEAGVQRVFGDATANDIYFGICEFLEIDPIQSDTIRTLVLFTYDLGGTVQDADKTEDYVKESRAYKFLTEAYDG